jgi:S-DNA-T family DNA segregation ATPase FtsK/SpoIIIE
MTRRGKRKSKRSTSFLDKVRGWRPDWRLDWLREPQPIQREILGLALLILAALTVLGLSRISSGALLEWWATALRQVFGWGAYLIALGLALLGLRLVWRQFQEKVPIETENVIGMELLLLVLLTASHVPLVLTTGADEAVLAAQDGLGGGYVGWAFSMLLMEGLGVLAGSVILLTISGIALLLLFSVTWQEATGWSHYQARRVVARVRRWQLARQGTVVEPEGPEEPWWEQPAPKSAKKSKKTKSKKRGRRKKAAPRPADGVLPPLDLLDLGSPQAYGDTDVRRKTRLIEETLESFGVPAQVVEVSQGPTVTQFGLDPGYIERRSAGGEVHRQRVRVAKIAGLADDLALALAASPIRIEAPVPGRSVVGLEVPNEQIALVSLRGVLEAPEFQEIDSPLAIALGEDVAGHPAAVDLALMPHLLIAGATGSGKSVCINAIISCLLCNNTPEDLQMLMIDPKMVELVGYNGIPHLIAPVVVEIDQVVGTLAWVTRQMDQRYKLFHESGARNLEDYNRKARRRKKREPLSNLVVFVDELADLMMVAPDDVERHITRVAQMGRATGIHLVIATQRPSVDVVTGLIKANFPARISFAVTSQVDSRVILDQTGAENLLGRGDMLFVSPYEAGPVRLQGCFVSDKEIDRLTEFWKGQEQYDAQTGSQAPWAQLKLEEEKDSLLDEAIQLAEGRDNISTSFIQRRLHEEQDIVGPDQGGGRGRQVLVGRKVDFDEIDERLPGVEPG